MKLKIVSIFSMSLVLATTMFSIASAKESTALNVGVDTKVQLEGKATGTLLKINTNNRITSTTTSPRNENATDTSERNNNATKTPERNNNATTTEANDNGQLNADSHRSTVALFVQSLLSIANREGGIGSQVRVIAQKQNDSASTTAVAIAKVDDKGAFRTFLFGPDYKNLGVIRSELAVTNSTILQLKTLLNTTLDAESRIELNAQIKSLENEQAKIEAYITAREAVFSLFGWWNK